jgi:hypothetical protein
MHYELRSNRVKMFMPEGGEVGEEDWFNILLVHQNRSAFMIMDRVSADDQGEAWSSAECPGRNV